jgi:benzylsuccinate CoA-transferase BbsE subunit
MLIADAGMLIEAEPLQSLTTRRLDYESLHDAFANLIVVSLSGFGRSGPRRGWQATELVAQAVGGMAYTTGKPTTAPLKVWGDQAIQLAGMFGAIGAMLALAQRSATGNGLHVDIGMQEAVASALEIVLPWVLYDPYRVHSRQGTLHWSHAFNVFPAANGHVLMTLNQNWETLIGWLDSDGMAQDLTDPQYGDAAVRRERLDHIIDVLQGWSRTKSVEELMQQGQLLRFTWGQVNVPDGVLANEQLRERGFFVGLDHPTEGRSFTYGGAAAKFSATPWRLRRPAPRLGEHNDEIGM